MTLDKKVKEEEIPVIIEGEIEFEPSNLDLDDDGSMSEPSFSSDKKEEKPDDTDEKIEKLPDAGDERIDDNGEDGETLEEPGDNGDVEELSDDDSYEPSNEEM